jgi:hypothetical protein
MPSAANAPLVRPALTDLATTSATLALGMAASGTITRHNVNKSKLLTGASAHSY